LFIVKKSRGRLVSSQQAEASVVTTPPLPKQR
jgi:hypothetical protein